MRHHSGRFLPCFLKIAVFFIVIITPVIGRMSPTGWRRKCVLFFLNDDWQCKVILLLDAFNVFCFVKAWGALGMQNKYLKDALSAQKVVSSKDDFGYMVSSNANHLKALALFKTEVMAKGAILSILLAVIWASVMALRQSHTAASPPIALIFITGITFYFYALVFFQKQDKAAVVWFVLWGLFVLEMLGTTMWYSTDQFTYVKHHRATGLWEDPEIYGLMAGLTFLAFLTYLAAIGFDTKKKPRSPRNYLDTVIQWLPAFPAALSFIGLVQSYTRGAWGGVAIGSLIITYNGMKATSLRGETETRKMHQAFTRVGLVLMAAACVVLVYVNQKEDGNGYFVRRLSSVYNINDFSWRNRVRAWVGALQMVAERPLAGYGWNKIGTAYDQLYSDPAIIEGGAIYVNDFCSVSTSAGLPVVIFLVFGVTLQLMVDYRENNLASSMGNNAQCEESCDWYNVGRWACLSVLMSGSFLNGVLIQVPLACAFWFILGARFRLPVGEGAKVDYAKHPYSKQSFVPL